VQIVTWNVNSVRLRAEQVARFVREQAPEITDIPIPEVSLSSFDQLLSGSEGVQ